MGNFNELMKAGRHQATQPPAKLRHKGPGNRPPSRNCNIVIHITLLQADIDDLREPTNSAQTLRLRESDVEILKDTAHQLGKTMKKKVTQSDVVRLAIRIAQKLAASKDGAVGEVLGQIK